MEKDPYSIFEEDIFRAYKIRSRIFGCILSHIFRNKSLFLLAKNDKRPEENSKKMVCCQVTALLMRQAAKPNK